MGKTRLYSNSFGRFTTGDELLRTVASIFHIGEVCDSVTLHTELARSSQVRATSYRSVAELVSVMAPSFPFNPMLVSELERLRAGASFAAISKE
jgi:hypothetical protein